MEFLNTNSGLIPFKAGINVSGDGQGPGAYSSGLLCVSAIVRTSIFNKGNDSATLPIVMDVSTLRPVLLMDCNS